MPRGVKSTTDLSAYRRGKSVQTTRTAADVQTDMAVADVVVPDMEPWCPEITGRVIAVDAVN